MNMELYPSIMCAKPWELKEYIELFEKNNIKAIHFDVMDGHFVPNITLGVCEFNAIRELTNIPIDVHLMTNEPEKFIDYFKLKENDKISFHPETTKEPIALLKTLKERKLKVGYAISPDTTIDYLKPALEILDFVLVMAVYPGFAGQKMVSNHLDKLSSISGLISQSGRDIEIVVDGNTNAENTIKMYKNGARGFVAGTSSLFKIDPSHFDENMQNYLNEVNKNI